MRRWFTSRAASPLISSLALDNSLTAINTSNNDRPDVILPNVFATNPVCNNGATPCVQYLNKAAFIPNPLGTYGNLGRNSIRGPGNVNVDVALSRLFRITERFSLQARMDTFNVFNHANFVGNISPAGTVSAYPTFSSGHNNNLTAATFGRIQAAFDPRILQFAMKLFF